MRPVSSVLLSCLQLMLPTTVTSVPMTIHPRGGGLGCSWHIEVCVASVIFTKAGMRGYFPFLFHLYVTGSHSV